MSEYNSYEISALASIVQFGKNGGFLRYDGTDTNFVFTQEDGITPGKLNGSSAIFTDNVTIVSSTGTLSIRGAQLGYDNSGSLQFLGSGAVIIPVGVNAARPAAPKVGMLRINTEINPYLETFNGTQWTSVSSTSVAGSTTQIQYNSNGVLGASARFAITFNEMQASTTIKVGDPSTFSSTAGTASIAYIDGGMSTDGKQGTNINLRGGNNSGTGNGGNAIVSGGYAIGVGTQAGNVVLMGGESSAGNHGHLLFYTVSQSGGAAERFKIAGGSGAWGLSGNNYGSTGQVLTSNGYNAPPTWTTVAGTAKQNFAFNSNQSVNVCIIPTGAVVLSISIVIMTPFNDPATTITVGDAAVIDRLFSADDNLAQVAGSYTVYPNLSYEIATQLSLTITGNSSAGSGIVTISYN